jgi:hypothetical protein
MATLGYTTAGSYGTASGSLVFCSYDVADGAGGQTTTIHVYCRNADTGDSRSVTVGIYADGGSGPSGSPLGTVEIVLPPSTVAGWKDASLSVALTAAAKYWLAFVTSAATAEVYYNENQGTNRMAYWTGTSLGTPGTVTLGNSRFSIYADYAASSPSSSLALLGVGPRGILQGICRGMAWLLPLFGSVYLRGF